MQHSFPRGFVNDIEPRDKQTEDPRHLGQEWSRGGAVDGHVTATHWHEWIGVHTLMDTTLPPPVTVKSPWLLRTFP